MRIVLVAMVVCSTSWACRCLAPRSPEEGWSQSTAVFSGRVKGVTQEKTTDRFSTKVEFEVLGAWKGITGSSAVVYTGPSKKDCGYPFVPGKRYLVFAFDEGPYKTDRCTRTVELDQSEKDEKFLRQKLLTAPQIRGSSGQKLAEQFYKVEREAVFQSVLDHERFGEVLSQSKGTLPVTVAHNRFTEGVNGLKLQGDALRVLERRKTPVGSSLIEFSSVRFEANGARVEFTYHPDEVLGEVDLAKQSGRWKVVRYELKRPSENGATPKGGG